MPSASEAWQSAFDAVRTWAERACAAGWLQPELVPQLDAIERQTPAQLFTLARPLVAAFFGGTGVGKSSLLNRLAGAPIARVGVPRPTSREVTLYVHEEVSLADLPAELRGSDVQVVRHDVAARRDVLWIDTPDINSTEIRNRAATLSWLRHVDLLVYVVSPERYRDDAGWRVLLERAGRHGWLFVLNRWDEGVAEQRSDWCELLRQAGFDDPWVFCTSCASGRPDGRAADPLDEIVNALQREHAARELERCGIAARVADVQRWLRAAGAQLGDEAAWSRLRDTLAQAWGATRESLLLGWRWGVAGIAASCAARPGDAEALRCGSLWDSWCDARLSDVQDRVEQTARRAGLAPAHVDASLDAARRDAPAALIGSSESALRTGLARPGTPLRRALWRIARLGSRWLPLAALLVVAWNVVAGYWRATTGAAPFPGLNFALNSALLVAIAWALPAWLERVLRPDLERAARRALETALDRALDDFGARLVDGLDRARDAARAQRGELEALAHALRPLEGGAPDAVSPAVKRLLPRRDARGRPGAPE